MSERLIPPEQPRPIAGRAADEWHTWLTNHNGEPAGHLEAPGSRYGRDADGCAWYAVALLAIYEASGADPEDAEAIIDFSMGLVVNDNEDVALMLLEHWHDVPDELQEQLGGRDRVEELLHE